MANNPETQRPVLLLTRPIAASQAMVRRLELPLRIVISPILEIVGRPVDLPPAAGLILSSAQAAAEAARQTVDRVLPVFTVGETTARAARSMGWQARCMGRTADELVQTLIDRAPKLPLLHLHGTHTRGDIARRLTEQGVTTLERVIYDQSPRALSSQAHDALNGADPVILPIFSPRTAVLLSEAVKPLAPVHVIALSSAVTEEFHVPDIRSLHVCDAPTREAMDAALRAVAGNLCRVERLRDEH